MRKRTSARTWPVHSKCPNRHDVALYLTLPDYGDPDSLYQCRRCGDIVIVKPESEFYIGPDWEELRRSARCPTCSDSLEFALSYPDNFRCEECGAVGHFIQQVDAYPDDSADTVLEGWDPYK